MSRGVVNARAAVSCSSALLALFLAAPAQARRTGLASSGCQGCHTGGAAPSVTFATDPAVFAPGATITATVTIQARNGPTAGMFIRASDGKFSLIGGQPTTLQSDTEVTHSAPKMAAGASVVFQVHWTAPSQPGGVLFDVWGLSANNDGRPSGDGEGSTSVSLPYGCPGTPYYIDLDGDGFAGKDETVWISCTQPLGYASVRGDCNDNDRAIHPGASERCNRLDDNCDGVVDEGLETGSVTLHTDADGDGYGSASGPTVVVQGCAAMVGYAPSTNDCNDRNPAIHPDALDVCNALDDDCNGQIDEHTRPTCGVGACSKRSPTCLPADCVPGVAIAEVCNAADDDCDGAIDNGEGLCGAGQTCRRGLCVNDSVAGTAGGAMVGAAGGPTNGAAGGALNGAAGGAPNSGDGSAVDVAAAGPIKTGNCAVFSGAVGTNGTGLGVLVSALLLAVGRRRRRGSGALRS